MDYIDIRNIKKIILLQQQINPTLLDGYYCLYYDETDNIKKFKIREDDSTNVPADSIFVLGGLEGKTTLTLEELISIFKLQKNIKEIKSKHIYQGDFLNILKSDRLNSYLNLCLKNSWHIHFNSLNLRYWSLTDILDFIESFKSQNKDKQYALKALLYKVIKIKKNDYFKFLKDYNYPAVESEKLKNFYSELIFFVSCTYFINPQLNSLKIELIDLLKDGMNKTEAKFIYNNQPLTLLNTLTDWYVEEIYSWINSTLVFDIENDILEDLKKDHIILNNQPVTNFRFATSNSEIMIQLSDVAVGIIVRYLKFIDQKTYEIPTVVSNLNEKQRTNFHLLNQILYISRTYNPIFFHQINSIELNGIFNNVIDTFR